MKTVLLTGATGFIGRHALAPLVARGYQIHAVTTQRQLTLASDSVVTWHVVDLLESTQMCALVDIIHPDSLLHFAWYVEPGKFWNSAENLRWMEASMALMRAFVDAGGRRMVLAGTCAEYDWSQDVVCIENKTPLRPATLYGVGKNALRQVAEAFAASAGLSCAWGRIFSPYGPGEHPRRLVASVINSLLRGEAAPCSHGEQLRDYMLTADIADAFVALLDCQVGGPVNIASGVPVSIKDLVYMIADQLRRPELIHLGALAAAKDEPLILAADATRLQSEVNWSPRFDLAAGIAQTIAWWRSHL